MIIGCRQASAHWLKTSATTLHASGNRRRWAAGGGRNLVTSTGGPGRVIVSAPRLVLSYRPIIGSWRVGRKEECTSRADGGRRAVRWISARPQPGTVLRRTDCPTARL